MKQQKPRLIIWLLALLSLGMAAASQAEVVVIGHPAIGADSLTAKEAARIWLGKAKTLPGGGKPHVVDQQPGSAVRNAFYGKAVKKTESQLKSYWAKVVFTGKGAPPKALADDAAVKQWVASTPGGLGYIDGGAVDDSVKVLLRLP